MQAKPSRPLRQALLDDPIRNKDIRADHIELNFQLTFFQSKRCFVFINNIITFPLY
jgi:hypothetical protein